MKKFFFVGLALAALLSSCDGAKKRDEIAIAAWNAQTFFDATEDGGEYSEFRGAKSGWSEEKYAARLKKIAAQLERLECDVAVLVEIESEAVVRDIANFLKDGAFKFAAFAGETGGVFGCAVFSKLPILQVREHQLDLRHAEIGKQPSTRPLVEVQIARDEKLTKERFSAGDWSADEVFSVLACHWKSKSGGAEKSEIWRSAQGALLAQVALDVAAQFPNSAVLACGDFNKDFFDFEFFDESTVRFGAKSGEALFFNPWSGYARDCAESGGDEKGTYFFDGAWEKIDNFFLLKGADGEAQSEFSLRDFCVCDDGDFSDADGRPARYKVFNGFGSSDHFPIRAKLCF